MSERKKDTKILAFVKEVILPADTFTPSIGKLSVPLTIPPTEVGVIILAGSSTHELVKIIWLIIISSINNL